MASYAQSLEGGAFATAYGAGTGSTGTPAPMLDVPGPPHLPGAVALGTDGGLWVFCKLAASQTIAAGDYVYVSSVNFEVTSLANAAKALLGALVGVAGAAATSSTTSYQYIWVQRAGYNASTNVTTAATANTVMHTSASGGRIGTASTGGTTAAVSGVVAISAAASNVAPVWLNYPVISTAD